MRRFAILITALAVAMSALVVSQAHAAVLSNGTYQCTTGSASSSTPNFTITGGVVTAGSSCVGAVIIPEGVTSIGVSAFEGATLLSSITIPSSVTSIEDYAFVRATALTSVTIPAGVTSIGESAFEGASLLTSVYFLGNAPTLSGTYVFSSVAAAAKAYVKSSATGFDTTGSPALWKGLVVEAYSPNGTYLCTTGLPSSSGPSFTITDGVVSLGNSCNGIVVIPAGVTSIGDDAFSSSGITSITIPSTATSIRENAFKWAFSLTSITIPSSVTSIGLSAFASATSLTNITIPSSVTSIGAGAFYGASSLASVYFLGNAPPTVGFGPFLDIAAGAKAYITSTATGFASVGQSWNGLTVEIYASDGTYLCTTGLASSSTPNFTITNRVVSEGSSCTGAVVIPSSVTGIGDNAFSGSGITSITIPAGVTSIGDSAFEGANSLSSITIPAGVTSIGTNAFARAAAISSITVESGNTNYSSTGGVLFNKLSTSLISYPAGKSGASYSIPSSVTSINGWAFSFASSLTSITIPSSVTSIGVYAFYSASSLTSISIPAGVTSIGNFAFANATALGSIHFLGNAPATIGTDAFSYVATGAKAHITSSAIGFDTTGTPPLWNGLTVEREVELDTSNGTYLCTTGLRSSSTPNFTITNGVVTDGSSCTGAVVIPAWVTSIGDRAFDVSTSISSPTTVTFGSGSMLTSIGDYAFNGAASLTSIIIPAGVTSIGDYAFKGAESLTSITIPTAVTNIGNGALVWTSALTSIMVESGNTNYSSIDGVLFNKSSTTLIRYPAKKTGATYSIPAGVTRIGDYGFSGATSLSSIIIPAGVTSIGFGAFESVISLTSITIPASVKSISGYAFYLSRSLSSVYFLGNGPTIGTNAFLFVSSGAKAYVISTATGFAKAGTTWNGLTIATHAPNGKYLCTTGMPSSSTPSFTVSDGVVSDGSSCAGTIVIPDGVTSIGNNAFENATALTTVTFGSGSVLVSIGNQAFKGTTSLTNITVDVGTEFIVSPKSVPSNKVSTTSVRATALTSGINFPASLTSIGGYAFSGATSITSITIPAGVTSIGEYAFSGATALGSVYFLGNKPTIGTNAFSNVALGAKALITPEATGFGTPGTSAALNGLIVEVVGATPAVVTDTTIVSNPTTVVDNSAARAAAAELASRTISKKKSYVVKTLAKRVGIKIVSLKATVSLSVSKTSKKTCLVSKSKLSTLKAGKCTVTFTVQEPTPKKGKKPIAKKTVKTLVVQ
ncbi:MAG: leucine-rich repeat domain-containing protein [Ilumatobacteraceae bacterium]